MSLFHWGHILTHIPVGAALFIDKKNEAKTA